MVDKMRALMLDLRTSGGFRSGVVSRWRGLARLHQHVEHHLWVVDRVWLGDPYNVTETDVLGVIRWAPDKADGHPRVTRAGDPGL